MIPQEEADLIDVLKVAFLWLSEEQCARLARHIIAEMSQKGWIFVDGDSL